MPCRFQGHSKSSMYPIKACQQCL